MSKGSAHHVQDVRESAPSNGAARDLEIPTFESRSGGARTSNNVGSPGTSRFARSAPSESRRPRSMVAVNVNMAQVEKVRAARQQMGLPTTTAYLGGSQRDVGDAQGTEAKPDRRADQTTKPASQALTTPRGKPTTSSAWHAASAKGRPRSTRPSIPSAGPQKKAVLSDARPLPGLGSSAEEAPLQVPGGVDQMQRVDKPSSRRLIRRFLEWSSINQPSNEPKFQLSRYETQRKPRVATSKTRPGTETSKKAESRSELRATDREGLKARLQNAGAKPQRPRLARPEVKRSATRSASSQGSPSPKEDHASVLGGSHSEPLTGDAAVALRADTGLLAPERPMGFKAQRPNSSSVNTIAQRQRTVHNSPRSISSASPGALLPKKPVLGMSAESSVAKLARRVAGSPSSNASPVRPTRQKKSRGRQPVDVARVVGGTAMILVAIAVLSKAPLKTWFEQRQAIASTSSDLSVAKAHLDGLDQRLCWATQDDYVERQARQMFSRVQPGQIVYRVAFDNSVPIQTSGDAARCVPTPEQPMGTSNLDVLPSMVLVQALPAIPVWNGHTV